MGEESLTDRAARKLADLLPRKVVYFAAIRLFVHATTGKWEQQNVPELYAMDALNRWHD
jgi:hypothetical protein